MNVMSFRYGHTLVGIGNVAYMFGGAIPSFADSTFDLNDFIFRDTCTYLLDEYTQIVSDALYIVEIIGGGSLDPDKSNVQFNFTSICILMNGHYKHLTLQIYHLPLADQV
jgi:hypothetical protein